MNGTEARLYVAWKEGTDFNMAKVESFLLQRLNDYAELQQIVKNILDWGREHRFAQIKENPKPQRDDSPLTWRMVVAGNGKG